MGEHKPRDKCGVFGYFGKNLASERVFYGLHAIQHRGQESGGIASWDGEKHRIKRGMGIVNDIFDTEMIEMLDGKAAIGHVRYSTQGGCEIENAQPFVEMSRDESYEIAIAHNGEIANHQLLRNALCREGIEFKTRSDTEIFLKLLTNQSGNLEDRIIKASRMAQPSYAMVILGQNKLIGLRDSAGVRPLCVGETSTGYVLASESCGISAVRGKYLRNVEPGEMLVIDDRGLDSFEIPRECPLQECIFENIYFSRPDSLISLNISNRMVREEWGRIMYRENPIKADVIIGVPDSSRNQADGMSQESGIAHLFGMIRSHYIGRSFIEPSQELRELAVSKKFGLDPTLVYGKKVVLVDDSLIRGTTMRNLVDFTRWSGAKEVHVMIASPPYLNSCYMGVNTSEEKLLIARQNTVEETRKEIGADSLYYLSKEGMLSNKYLTNKNQYCTYCFDGKVIIPPDVI